MKGKIPTLFIFILTVVIPSYGQKAQPAQQDENQGRDAAIAQMRGIAAEMKACAEEVQSKTDLATYYAGRPTNLEWDVKKSETARSPFQGIITFTLPERSEETDKAKQSKKLHKQYMDAEVYKAAYGHTGHYQYEFDLGNGAPDLVKVLLIDDRTKESEPASHDGRGPSCWDKVAHSPSKAE